VLKPVMLKPSETETQLSKLCQARFLKCVLASEYSKCLFDPSRSKHFEKICSPCN